MCVNDVEPVLCYFSSYYTSVNTVSVVNWNGKHGETDRCKLAYRPIQRHFLKSADVVLLAVCIRSSLTPYDLFSFRLQLVDRSLFTH